MAVKSTNVGESQQAPQELYMLSKRDNVEKERLDAQSSIIKIVRNGCILDPAIPMASVHKIADIATGTGIWMREVSAELAAAGLSSPLETVGFDISVDQFPTNHSPATKFVVWDATKIFPSNYHNQFDVVHARLLTVAVTVEQIKTIAKNAAELLKPGGYLQWTDWTYKNGHEIIYPSVNGESSLSCDGEQMFRFHGEQGFSYDTCGDVAEALKDSEIDVVRLTDHTDASYKPDIRDLVADWHSRVIPLFMEAMLRRKGYSEEESKARANGYRDEVLRMRRKGAIFVVPITTLVARKRL